MEHGADRADEVFLWGGGEHPGASRPAGEVREQDPDTYQDRPQLQDALQIPPGRLLHAQGTRR